MMWPLSFGMRSPLLSYVTNAPAYSIAYIASRAGRDALGAFLRGEPIEKPDAFLLRRRADLDDAYKAANPEDE
jgi:hypothetical protein